MTNDVEKTEAGLPAPIKAAVENIPTSLKLRAAKLAFRLLAGSDAATSFVAQARDRWDTMDGKSYVAGELAKAVAAKAVTDPLILDRATERFLGESVRKQSNIESITRLAIEDLRNEPESSDELIIEVDNNWVNKFSRFAEDVSSNEAQLLWGRVLSGEIKSPGSFSLRTLRFLSELDKNVADTFIEVTKHSLYGNCIFAPAELWNSGEPLRKLKLLVEAGLLSEIAGSTNRPAKRDENGNLFIWQERSAFVARCHADLDINIPICQFTTVGEDIFRLLEPNDEASILEKIYIHFEETIKSCSNLAFIGPVTTTGETMTVNLAKLLWSNVNDPTPSTTP